MTNLTGIVRTPLYGANVADDLDPHPQRVAGQIGDRNILDLDEVERVRVGAGLDRLLFAERARGGDRLAARHALEHLVDLAADLRDRRADRIGAAAMLDPDHPGDAGELVGDQEGAAAD